MIPNECRCEALQSSGSSGFRSPPVLQVKGAPTSTGARHKCSGSSGCSGPSAPLGPRVSRPPGGWSSLAPGFLVLSKRSEILDTSRGRVSAWWPGLGPSSSMACSPGQTTPWRGRRPGPLPSPRGAAVTRCVRGTDLAKGNSEHISDGMRPGTVAGGGAVGGEERHDRQQLGLPRTYLRQFSSNGRYLKGEGEVQT